MSEMVERVARALFTAYQKRLPNPDRFSHITWEICTDVHESYCELARTAIVAMREPTKAMITIDGNFSAALRVAIWREMIDEALK